MRALILLGDSWIVREISNRWKSRGVRPHAQVALGARRAFLIASSSSRVREEDEEEIRKREREDERDDASERKRIINNACACICLR